MTARQFAKHRETFCLASAGSDEEFRAYLSGFDAAVAIADLAAAPAQAQGAKPLHLPDNLRGQLWQIVLKMTACDDEGCGQNNCSCMARYARILAAIEPQPDPRDEVIARLAEATEQFLIEYDEVDLAVHEPKSLTDAVYEARAALAAAKAVQHG